MKKTLLNPTVLGILVVIAIVTLVYVTGFDCLNYAK